jgi:CPA1 family monovalent cation:H+ antiporter
MVGLPGVMLAIAFLLVLVSVAQPIARRLALPETVVLAVVGVMIGGGAEILLRLPHIHAFDGAAIAVLDLPFDSETILLVFLPVLVFSGSLAIDVRRLSHDAVSVLTLAVVAVVVSTAVIGLAVSPFANMPLTVCLLLGAIVANTDPSAVTAIFRDIGAASRLTRLVEAEALLNDAAAISIFSILIDAVTHHKPVAFGAAAWLFTTSFLGALVVGVVLARLTLLLIVVAGETVAGEVSLTFALPFITYIVCEHGLHLSGVVAVAASGLTLSMYGPSTMRPQNWRFLTELWEQFAFWAGSLVFVLASMLVARLMLDLTGRDVLLVGVVVVASLVARGAVLFGLLPLLSVARLSRPVPNRYKTTMLWGGLRGAITLALVLAVTENPLVSGKTAHFVAVVATGFVLVTLLVNGITLRPLVIRLGLDRLSPRDAALKQQVLAIGLEEIRDRTRGVAEEFGFSAGAIRHVVGGLQKRVESEQGRNDFEAAISDRERISLALITIAARERAMLIDGFRFRGLSRGVIEQLLRTADAMVDGARMDGRTGFIRAARGRLRPTLGFRIAQILHQTIRFDAPLVTQMTARYEMLLVSHLLAQSLIRFMHQRIEPMLGVRVAEIVSDVLERRSALLSEALDAMRLHYGGYAEALEGRLLRLLALRMETEEYDGLMADSLIGEELHHELVTGVEGQRRRLRRRLKFNLASGLDGRLRSFALFRDVPDAILHDLAMTVSVRFAIPGEVLIRRGRRPRLVFIVSSGTLEASAGDARRRYAAGDVIGGAEAIGRQRVTATVRCLTFSHLLAVQASDFRQLVEDNPVIGENMAGRREQDLPLLTA